MATYKHMRTGRVITESDYRRLSSYDQREYSYNGSSSSDSSGDFLTSAAIGYATDNALLGGILGGDMAGGIVGDLLSGDGLFD